MIIEKDSSKESWGNAPTGVGILGPCIRTELNQVQTEGSRTRFQDLLKRTPSNPQLTESS